MMPTAKGQYNKCYSYWIMEDDNGHLRVYGIRNHLYPFSMPILWSGDNYAEALAECSRLVKERRRIYETKSFHLPHLRA